MKTEIERYKKALEVAMLAYRGAAQWHIDATDKEIESILNPPVEMETVAVKRSMCGNCGTVWKTDQDCVNCCEATATCKTPIVHLTGSYQRPKPVPVERSVSVEGAICTAGHLTMTDKALYEFPEARGKRGVLSFAWTE